ncbi:hypothetical protein IL54_3259 [Sphingobium sp. ba1]|nr:hypothetical protein IL54_3259 [Sphingobium sp. ba1]
MYRQTFKATILTNYYRTVITIDRKRTSI